MSLQQIESLVAVAETGSVTEAALRLRIAQPAVSRQIRRLEDELGVRLFGRGRRGMELTDAGHRAVDRARAVLRAVESLRDTETNTARDERSPTRRA
jgi:LysR family nitrogen assimilation transcriptional regulator